jgi:hypothetical protein
LAAEGELAVDDRAAESAFGVVVGRLNAVLLSEAPEHGPNFQEVVRETAGALVARRIGAGAVCPGGVLPVRSINMSRVPVLRRSSCP